MLKEQEKLGMGINQYFAVTIYRRIAFIPGLCKKMGKYGKSFKFD